LSTNDYKISWEKPKQLPKSVKIVDSREPEIIRSKLLEYGWEQRQLYSGDYFFMTGDFKKVVVTRKAIDDLVGSIGDRFSKQLEEMIDDSDKLILLLEGSWRMVNPANNLITGHGVSYNTWSMVWNYLRRWQDKGFTIELTVNEGHTIQRLNELYALYQKVYSMSSKSKDWTDDRVLSFPSGCRGKSAMSCLEEFGSLKNVADATEGEILRRMQGKNIGQKKAHLIFTHFNRGGETEESETKEQGEMNI
jgi:ERCC4-type nuclease